MSDLTVEQLDEAISAVMANSRSLIEEAQILCAHKRYARAYTLAHIAREEIAKVTMLYSAGLRCLAGRPVDWRKLHRRLRDHTAKLSSDALAQYVHGLGSDQPKGTLRLMLSATRDRNNWKNDSLYVGIEGTKVTIPDKLFPPRKAERTICLAIFAWQDVQFWIHQGGNLSKRDAAAVKAMFDSVPDPDNQDAQTVLKTIEALSSKMTEFYKKKASENGDNSNAT